jgi:hypothetical protein
MGQSPSWEADISSSSEEIPHTLWNPIIQYFTHKSQPPVSNRIQIDLIRTSNQFKIHFNSIINMSHV